MDLIPLPESAVPDPEGRRHTFGPEPVLDAGPGTGGVARWLRREVGAATGWALPAPAPGARGDVRLRIAPRGADGEPAGCGPRRTGSTSAPAAWN